MTEALSASSLSIANTRSDDVWITPRPWLTLYGRYLRRNRVQVENKCHEALQSEEAWHAVADDLFRNIFLRLSPATLVTASLTCRHWHALAQDPHVWKHHCLHAFASTPAADNYSMVQKHYGHSWKRMFVERPHVRFDGIYVSRNTYFRLGAVSWDVRNPVHLVVYYRYIRFFSDGTVLTRTSPDPVKTVWKGMYKMPYYIEKGDPRMPGRWKLLGSTCFVACIYPGYNEAEARTKLKLRTRTPGLNNRLDVIERFTYDRKDGTTATMEDPAAEDDAQEKIVSKKGANSFVFVPWHEVNSHIINLNKQEMDVFIPG